MFENPRRGRQARNFSTNVPKILDLKSSSGQIFSENCRWVPLQTGHLRVLCPGWQFSILSVKSTKLSLLFSYHRTRKLPLCIKRNVIMIYVTFEDMTFLLTMLGTPLEGI